MASIGTQRCFRRKRGARYGRRRTVTPFRSVIVRTLLVRIIVFVVLLRCAIQAAFWSDAIAFYRGCDAPFESSSASSSSSDSEPEYPSAKGPGRPVLESKRSSRATCQGLSGVDIQGRHVCGIVIIRQSWAMVEHIPDIVWVVIRLDRGWNSDRHRSK